MNPYFPTQKTNIKTALYTPVTPLGWANFLPSWINPQSVTKKSATPVRKGVKKPAYTISSKTAKVIPVPVPNSPVKLSSYFKVSLLCTGLLIGLFIYNKNQK